MNMLIQILWVILTIENLLQKIHIKDNLTDTMKKPINANKFEW